MLERMPIADPLDATASEMLRRFWRIVAVPERTAAGVSRDTWSIDGAFWLSHSDPTEEDRLRREAELLRALPGEIARCGASWQVPEVALTTEGDSVATSDDGVWRLTRHLSGEELDMRESESYPRLARMLAELHAVLERVPESLKVWERGTVERARELVEAYHGGSFAAVTENPSERDIVRAIAGWLVLLPKTFP